jgi:GNAT superfamily N-acetyltransferase
MSDRGAIEIKVMQQADIPFVVEMTAAEGWGHSEADIGRLLALSPDGCFVAWDRDERIGTITSTRYEDFAFVAVLIVREEYRGHGIGRRLLERAIDYLRSQGVSTIELDGVLKAVPLYRRLDFRDKYLSLRFHGSATDYGEHCDRYDRSLREEILAFDRDRVGLARRAVIDCLLSEFVDSTYVLRESSVLAYTILRQREDGCFTLGPLIAEGPADAIQLLKAVLSLHVGGKFRVGVPDPHDEIVEFLRESDFEQSDPSLRMYLGERREYERHVFAIISAEKS